MPAVKPYLELAQQITQAELQAQQERERAEQAEQELAKLRVLLQVKGINVDKL